MATLVTRPGDPQALKAAAAAAAAGTPLAVQPLGEAAAWKKLLADSSCPEAARQLFLVLPDGTALADPNAITRYLGEPSPASLHCTGLFAALFRRWPHVYRAGVVQQQEQQPQSCCRCRAAPQHRPARVAQLTAHA